MELVVEPQEEARKDTIRYTPSIQSVFSLTPFMYMSEQFGYSAESIFRPVPSQTAFHLGTYPDTFPNTIAKYFWVQEGIPGSLPWIALGELIDGMYFYYTAYTDNADGCFLNKKGHMNLWISMRYSDLIHFGMDTTSYKAYIEQTKE